MDGRVRWAQSVEAPWRTNSALVKATKDMVMAKMPTQIPLWEDSAAVLGRTLAIAAAEPSARSSGVASAATCGWIVVDMLYRPLRISRVWRVAKNVRLPDRVGADARRPLPAVSNRR